MQTQSRLDDLRAAEAPSSADGGCPASSSTPSALPPLPPEALEQALALMQQPPEPRQQPRQLSDEEQVALAQEHGPQMDDEGLPDLRTEGRTAELNKRLDAYHAARDVWAREHLGITGEELDAKRMRIVQAEVDRLNAQPAQPAFKEQTTMTQTPDAGARAWAEFQQAHPDLAADEAGARAAAAQYAREAAAQGLSFEQTCAGMADGVAQRMADTLEARQRKLWGDDG